MASVGYARVSSVGQSLDVQTEKLNKAGCEKIFSEKRSGKKADNRSQLQALLSWVREGDKVVITKMDRLARSTADLLNIINLLEEKRVGLIVLDQAIDTSTPTGRLMLTMLGAIAEFENELRRERQKDGIDSALKKGVVFGRKPALLTSEAQVINERIAEGQSVASLAREFGCSRQTIYNYVNKKTPPFGGVLF